MATPTAPVQKPAPTLDPNGGYFDAETLRRALGLQSANSFAQLVRNSVVPAPDYKPDPWNPITWIWWPWTVQSLFTQANVAAVVAAANHPETAQPWNGAPVTNPLAA